MLRTSSTRVLADAIVIEIEPLSLARVARGLEPSIDGHALLESVLPGDPWARWSFLAPGSSRQYAYGPDRAWSRFRAWPAPAGDSLDPAHPVEAELLAGGADPWRALDRAWSRLNAAAAAPRSRPATEDGTMPPFRGGFAVALSYDAARTLDDFASWPARAEEGERWPWFDVRLVGESIATHAATGRTFLVVATHPVFGDADARIEALSRRLDASSRAGRVPEFSEPDRDRIAPTPEPGEALRSNLSDAEYANAFDRLQEYLRAGDLYQANLTRRFDANARPLAGRHYERLRVTAPAPYAAWFAGPWGDALSASPELFLAREGDRLITRPIKGTRPRREDAAADAAEARELTASEKDRAEHVMIVDVHRNDLGRVCEFGSVRVETLAGLESFPTVHHLTSTIVGTPRAGVTPWQAIAAAFPAGSITGAPKRRAIEVLEELEPTRRGLYCGSMGWIGLDGDFALNVAIRTIVQRGEHVSFQAGGGIVIDSRCATEAEETWNKARALYAAIRPEPVS